MKKLISTFLLSAALLPLSAEIMNGSFNALGTPPDAKAVEAIRKNGIKCPDANQWPRWWGAVGKGGEISFPVGGRFIGRSGRFARITGKDTYIIGAHGKALKGDFVLELYTRGKGTLGIGFYSYERAGKGVKGAAPGNRASSATCNVDNENWERYRFRIVCPPALWQVHALFNAVKGTIDLDDLKIYRFNDAMLYLADAENHLRKKNAFPVMKPSFAIDEAMKKRTKWFADTFETFKKYPFKEDQKKTVDAIRNLAQQLLPYLVTDGLPNIKGQNVADMFILGSAMQSLMNGSRDIPAEIAFPAQ